MSTTDHLAVARALVALADTLEADRDVPELHQRLVDECTRLLDVPAAGLLLAGPDGRSRVAAASGKRVRGLHLLQLELDRGPCLEAHSRGERVVAGEPAELRARWGEFATGAAAAGFGSVVAVPLRLRGRALGALGLFGDRERVLGPEDADIAQALADVAAIGLLQQEAVRDSRSLSAQLQRALDTRVLVEQAKGVVAAQLGVDVEEAFTVIRRHARGRGLALRQVAGALVEGRLTGRDLQPGASRRRGADRR